jgi:hypothetical protein
MTRDREAHLNSVKPFLRLNDDLSKTNVTDVAQELCQLGDSGRTEFANR